MEVLLSVDDSMGRWTRGLKCVFEDVDRMKEERRKEERCLEFQWIKRYHRPLINGGEANLTRKVNVNHHLSSPASNSHFRSFGP